MPGRLRGSAHIFVSLALNSQAFFTSKIMATLYFESPVGLLRLEATNRALTGLYFENAPQPGVNNSHPILEEAEKQLDEYFAGARTEFDFEKLPLLVQGTDFQKRVWMHLRNIPFGETISYGELARRISQPTASRAVGMANGRNPISILVPCHRVIGAANKLVGYGGGLDRKKKLLALEGHVFEDQTESIARRHAKEMCSA
jgi:methylated-DNA-[protein]-cysteine S-methyltransferase